MCTDDWNHETEELLIRLQFNDYFFQLFLLYLEKKKESGMYVIFTRW